MLGSFLWMPPKETDCNETTPPVRFQKALTSNLTVNNRRRWEADYYPRWNNKRSLLKTSVPACRHKYFLITKAETRTKCVIPKSPKRTHPQRTGTVEVWCTTVTKNTLVYSPFHYSKNVLTRILTEKARISSWKTSCCLGVRSETCSVLHRILPSREIRVNTKLKHLKNSKVPRKKTVGSSQKELRIALHYFQCIFPLENIFRTSVLPIKLR